MPPLSPRQSLSPRITGAMVPRTPAKKKQNKRTQDNPDESLAKSKKLRLTSFELAEDNGHYINSTTSSILHSTANNKNPGRLGVKLKPQPSVGEDEDSEEETSKKAKSLKKMRSSKTKKKAPQKMEKPAGKTKATTQMMGDILMTNPGERESLIYEVQRELDLWNESDSGNGIN
ncbi:hypothetical protein E4T42_01636 [Aureobasidium subglaciale]|nr:hypothetical protein E4T42_01636 [Aureobasidium subglaciale]